MESEFQKTEKIALRLIARAEQCGASLARKLEKRGSAPESVQKVILRLKEQKLLDDARYARLWLQSRLRRARSPLRLLAGLQARGFCRSDAQNALDNVLDEETELAMLERFVKRYAKKAGSQIKFLLKSEGFSPRVINRAELENP